jgi:hypothetical protein
MADDGDGPECCHVLETASGSDEPKSASSRVEHDYCQLLRQRRSDHRRSIWNQLEKSGAVCAPLQHLGTRASCVVLCARVLDFSSVHCTSCKAPEA